MLPYQEQFIEFALKTGVLRFGEFTLKSGRISPYFFNTGLFDSGASMCQFSRFFACSIENSDLDFDVLFGPAYKGITLACATAMALSDATGKQVPFAFNRKEKKDHGEGGSMVFEPAVIKVSKGDTIHFKAVDMSHNSASLDGMIPDGASSWTGSLSKDISVKLDYEGVYVYQCDPHAMMAMVGVIQVGEAVNLSQVKEAADSKKSSFIMNSDRLQTYLSQL